MHYNVFRNFMERREKKTVDFGTQRWKNWPPPIYNTEYES